MPRPTPAQICWGTLAVVSATVVLLAVSGADSVPGITVLVVIALALGTLTAALPVTGRARRGRRSGSRIVGAGGTGQQQPHQPGRTGRTATGAGAGIAQPSSGPR